MTTETRAPLTPRPPLGPALTLGPAVAAVTLVLGWAVSVSSQNPLPLMALVGAGCLVVSFVRLELAAAGLAAIIAGNLSGIAVQEHGLPSPSMALAAFILLAILVRSDRAAFLPPIRLVVPFAVYGLVVLTSGFWASEPERTIAATTNMGRDVVYAMLVAVVVRRTGTFRLTLWAVMASTALLGLVAIVQFLTGDYGRTFGGLGGSVVANIVMGEDSERIVGPFADPNYFAQALLVGFGIAIARGVHERGWLRLGAIGAALVTAVAIVPTYSRGGAVAFVVLVGLLMVIRRPRPRVLALVAGLLVVAALLAPVEFRERLGAGLDLGGSAAAVDDPAVRGRISEMFAAAAMFRDAPLTGLGAGNYPAHYQEYAQAYQLDDRRTERAAHSLYLEILAETGIIGAFAFAGVVIAAAATLHRNRRWATRRSLTEATGRVGDALGLGLLGFLITSVLLHGAHLRSFWLLTALILALPTSDAEVVWDRAPELADRTARTSGANR